MGNKNGLKLLMTIVMIGTVGSIICSCGMTTGKNLEQEQADVLDTEAIAQQDVGVNTENQKEQEVESETETQTEQVAADRPQALEAYKMALENLLNNAVLPDGSVCDQSFMDYYSMSDNKFAVADYDQDGRDELLLSYTTDCMAGMAFFLYDYDSSTQTLRQELVEFPAVHIYNNGIILADWSHNQGVAGDNFWPYTMYQYDKTTDTYMQIASVDAWDKSYADTDYNGDPFPDDVDTDGDGMLYYVMEGEYSMDNPINQADYDTWLNGYIKDASIISDEVMDLSEENIQSIQ